MATLGDRPYGAFNFIVSIAGSDGASLQGGFSEVSGLGMEIVYVEYRNGNEKVNAPRKIPGLHKVNDVTLKRGVIGSTDLFSWLKGVADGTPDRRTVTIDLLDAQHQPVLRWVLRNAQPRKWSGPQLKGSGSEVAMEELVLTGESLEME